MVLGGKFFSMEIVIRENIKKESFMDQEFTGGHQVAVIKVSSFKDVSMDKGNGCLRLAIYIQDNIDRIKRMARVNIFGQMVVPMRESFSKTKSNF